MATSFFPFDAGTGSAITESSWQKMARRWLATGVHTSFLNQLQVTADGSGMTVSVNTGSAWIEGFYFDNDAAASQTITAAHATLSRIDRVAVRLDRTANTCAFVVIAGTAAASPVAPTLSVTDTLYEIGLATVLVDPAVGVIAAGKVTDTRTLVKNLTAAEAAATYVAKAGLTDSTVATSETTNSTAFVDLATVGPAVSATVVAGQRLIVNLSCELTNDTAGGGSFMGFALSGAAVRAAGITEVLAYSIPAAGGYILQASRQVVVPGLAAGTYTVTAKYRVNAGIGTFRYRTITAEAR